MFHHLLRLSNQVFQQQQRLFTCLHAQVGAEEDESQVGQTPRLDENGVPIDDEMDQSGQEYSQMQQSGIGGQSGDPSQLDPSQMSGAQSGLQASQGFPGNDSQGNYDAS